MKPVFFITMTILAGILFGAFGAYSSIVWINPRSLMVKMGDWYQMPVGQSEASKLWQRAWLSYHGPFALKESDVLYLARRRDDQGEPLRENCQYVVSGKKLPAKWWAITVYDQEGFLPESSLIPSRQSEDLPGEWEINLSSRSSPENIDTKSAGQFSLMLRLYGPETSSPGTIDQLLPRVKRLSCAGG